MFISYRNGAKQSYMEFVKQIYRMSVSKYIVKTLAFELFTDFIINSTKLNSAKALIFAIIINIKLMQQRSELT